MRKFNPDPDYSTKNSDRFGERSLYIVKHEDLTHTEAYLSPEFLREYSIGSMFEVEPLESPGVIWLSKVSTTTPRVTNSFLTLILWISGETRPRNIGTFALVLGGMSWTALRESDLRKGLSSLPRCCLRDTWDGAGKNPPLHYHI